MGNETQMLGVANYVGNGAPQLNRQYSMIITKLVIEGVARTLEMY